MRRIVHSRLSKNAKPVLEYLCQYPLFSLMANGCRQIDGCRFRNSAYLRHCSKNLLELLLGRIRKLYALDFGTESWVELLDTDGLELSVDSGFFHIA